MKRRTATWVLLPALLLLTGAMAGDAGEVVGIRLHGRFFSEPATVRLLVTVEPDADNRTLRIEADSADMFRASDVTLSGANDKRLHTIEFKNLSAGAYTLRAEVRSTSGVRGAATSEVLVTGMGMR